MAPMHAIAKLKREAPTTPYSLQAVQRPVPASGEVEVRTLFAGICATDLPYLTGSSDPRKRDAGGTPLEEFTVALHEAVGVVGDGNGTALTAGDIVVPLVRRCEEYVPGRPGAGFVPCLRAGGCAVFGQPERCPVPGAASSRGTGKLSGFGSQYFVDSYQWLIPVNPTLVEKVHGNTQFFTLCEPMAVAHRGVRLANSLRTQVFGYPFPARDNVLVAGLGAIGLLAAVSLVSFYGYRNVYGVDVVSASSIRARLFTDKGVHGLGMEGKYIDASRYSPGGPGGGGRYSDWLKEKAGGSGFHVIIEATGKPEVIGELIPALAPDGVLVALSFPDEKSRPVQITAEDFEQLVVQNKVIAGCVNLGRQDMLDAIELIVEAYDQRASMMYRMVKVIEPPSSVSTATGLLGGTAGYTGKSVKTVCDFSRLVQPNARSLACLNALRNLVGDGVPRCPEVKNHRDLFRGDFGAEGYRVLSSELHWEMAEACVLCGYFDEGVEEIDMAMQAASATVVESHRYLVRILDRFDSLQFGDDLEKAKAIKEVIGGPIDVLSRKYQGDPEIYGLAGRYWRTLWLLESDRSKRGEYWDKAVRCCEDAWVVHQESYFSLVNLASLYLQNMDERAIPCYQQVEDLCEKLEEQERDRSHWLDFTRGEANLVLANSASGASRAKRIAYAISAYEKGMKKIKPNRVRDAGSARKGLERIKDYLPAVMSDIDEVIRKLKTLET